MQENPRDSWKDRVIAPDQVLLKIEPGMSIFLGTGVAEPRTLVKHLKASTLGNLTDLELIQFVSLGDAISSIKPEESPKYRLKTFFSGWIASEAITSGNVDLIPSRFSHLPELVDSGVIHVDVAFIQITPPDPVGFCSLGVAVDAAKYAMEKASLVVGEINPWVPETMGATYVHVDDFHYFVEATERPLYFPRLPIDPVTDKVAENVASMIEDGSCLFFFPGVFFDALGRHLVRKRHLGIHTFFFTDALMDLVRCGAVTNREKGYFQGKSLTAYAQGTEELMTWLHRNPLVEFQPINIVSDHLRIGMNDRVIGILPARKIDLSGNVALHAGKGNVTASAGQAQEFFDAVNHSRGGRKMFAMASRNLKSESNILTSVEGLPNLFTNNETLDLIVTEFGVASMKGRTVRERAQALIDIAHPDDRLELVRKAKEMHILYKDQIYIAESGHLYPDHLTCTHVFNKDLTVVFRAIKPSDEEEMRRLFYRFSDQTVYYRYFSPIKAMPHRKMQEYVNVDYRRTMSIVGTVIETGIERIIAEGRYVRLHDRPYADTAFVVDEHYQGHGIATFLLQMLIGIAQEKGIEGFQAQVLADNKAMLAVYEKANLPIRAVMEHGVYNLTIPFGEPDNIQ
jgi:acyl-CoA hydrolase/GNAT superfamily N-acetyltransferase